MSVAIQKKFFQVTIKNFYINKHRNKVEGPVELDRFQYSQHEFMGRL